jgi:hypothetical protein
MATVPRIVLLFASIQALPNQRDRMRSTLVVDGW